MMRRLVSSVTPMLRMRRLAPVCLVRRSLCRLRSAHNVVVPASVADFGSGWRHGIGKFVNLRHLSLRQAMPPVTAAQVTGWLPVSTWASNSAGCPRL